MLECEGSGKTVEKAIDDALLTLKAFRDDVDIKILDTGGLFRKAKVLVSISPDCVEKYNKKQNKTKEVEPEKQVVQEPVQKNVCSIKDLTELEQLKSETKKQNTETKSKEKKEQQELLQNDNQKSNQDEVLLGKTFLQNFLKAINFDASVEVVESEDEVFYSINGNNVASLIGYRGECLNSLQFLVSVISGKNSRKNKKVRLDIDGYRERRKETLIALAHRVCKKVLKTQHSNKLEPMSAYERRIIHTIVADEYPDLESISKGEEPHRFLIIKPK